MESTVIVSGARTPIGKLAGSLKEWSAPALGGHAIQSALERANTSEVDAVFFGNVVQAGVGAGPARQASHKAGLPLTIPATTINKLCLSGLTAIALADQQIQLGYLTSAVAGGMESMTNAPYLARGARLGYKYGSATLDDALNFDGLLCGIEAEIMGAATERHQRSFNFSRAQVDEFAERSHFRAHQASESGQLASEIAPISIKSKGATISMNRDEGIRAETTAESLSKLRPAFAADGILTAGNSSQLSDGAAALVLMKKSEAQKRGLTWIAEIISYGTSAGPDTSLLLQPSAAIKDSLRRSNLALKDLHLFEINEAFSTVALASMNDLGISMDQVNIWGGATAIGHPVGASGARLVLTLAHQLRERGGGYGVASLCGGGGQGDALLIRVD